MSYRKTRSKKGESKLEETGRSVWDEIKKVLAEQQRQQERFESKEKNDEETKQTGELLKSPALDAEYKPWIKRGFNVRNEVSMLFVGPKESGKSTLIHQFLHPNKVPERIKPTIALDFTYGRKSDATGLKKNLVQIWELGGGGEENLMELLYVVASKERLQTGMVIVVVVDLAHPATGYRRSLFWLQKIAELQPKPSIILVGNKYDAFNTEDPLKVKLVYHAFRFLAVQYNCDILFVTRADKTSISLLRSLLSHYGFKGSKKETVQINPNKPLYVPKGHDTLEGIDKSSIEHLSQSSQIDFWYTTILQYFPEPEIPVKKESFSEHYDDISQDDTNDMNPKQHTIKVGKMELSSEPIVDECFLKKMERLKAYIAESECKDEDEA